MMSKKKAGKALIFELVFLEEMVFFLGMLYEWGGKRKESNAFFGYRFFGMFLLYRVLFKHCL